MNRFQRIFRRDASRNRLLIPSANRLSGQTLKTTLLSAIRTMAPTLFALSIAGVAHSQGTMDFSGATTLMTTFKSVIARALTKARNRTAYWLDLGNNAASGQFVLGQPLNARNRRKAARLRTVSELYPEIIDAEAGEDPLPSCSAVEALDRQEPFINQTLAASALAMLARLFRYGRLAHHGAFFNAETGRMTALPIDPPMWGRLRRHNRSCKAESKRIDDQIPPIEGCLTLLNSGTRDH